MKTYKIISAICIQVLFALVFLAFVASLACEEYLMTLGCAAEYSILKLMWWADGKENHS